MPRYVALAKALDELCVKHVRFNNTHRLQALCEHYHIHHPNSTSSTVSHILASAKSRILRLGFKDSIFGVM